MVRFLDSFGLVPRPEVQSKLLGRRLKEAIAISKEAYNLPGSELELAETYGRMRVDALKGNVKPLPGALEILSFARDSDIRIALATSGLREHASLTLVETGLAGRFDAEATGSDVDRGKPSPDLFLLAAERLKVRPDRIVVFEDSPLGVEAARNAGMRVAAVQGSRPIPLRFEIEPDLNFRDLHVAREWLANQVQDKSGP